MVEVEKDHIVLVIETLKNKGQEKNLQSNLSFIKII